MVEAAAVASLLHDEPCDSDALLSAELLIAEGQGRVLFEAFVDETEGDRQGRVRSTMSLLEQMVDASPRVAAYLMARLYPIAARSRDHETYRGIELWMHGFHTNGVADILKSLAAEDVRHSVKSRYEEWATLVDERAAKQT